MTKYQPAPPIEAVSISNEKISLFHLRGKKVLLKFHRFSGCPVAQRQVHALIEGQQQLNDAGIETIVFLHSSKEKIIANFTEVAGLHIIPDPKKLFYRLYGSEFSWGKLFSIASWRATFSSFLKGYFPQPGRFGGGIITVPADFLVDQQGRIAAWHYGKDYGDSWSVAELLKQASQLAAEPILATAKAS